MVWLLALALALAGCKDRSEAGHEVELTVMTRNVYVGADIDQLMHAAGPDIPALAARLWQDVEETDFAERAAALAEEIAATRPHLVGLQEISLFRMQSPGDYLAGNRAAAQDTALDFLAVLLEALRSRGLSYRAAAVTTDFDVELPMRTQAGLGDIRLTDHDAILVRSDVTVESVEQRNFATNQQIAVGGGPPVTIRRGWAAVAATIDGMTVRFVSTHLEPPESAAQIQASQALELRSELDRVDAPVIVVGDLNSNADGGSTPTYADFLAAGYVDAWDASAAAGSGNTCCHAADLQNAAPSLVKRIDHILVRGNFEAVSAQLVGHQITDRTPSGLWPSDHAGVVATLKAR